MLHIWLIASASLSLRQYSLRPRRIELGPTSLMQPVMRMKSNRGPTSKRTATVVAPAGGVVAPQKKLGVVELGGTGRTTLHVSAARSRIWHWMLRTESPAMSTSPESAPDT